MHLNLGVLTPPTSPENSTGSLGHINQVNTFILSEIIYKKSRHQNEQNHSFRDGRQMGHFSSLHKNITSISDGQATLEIEDNFAKFKINITPSGGPYVNGKFVFCIRLPVKYPRAAPHVVCETQIYHPNIDDEGEICLSIVDDWSTGNDLEDLVQGLLYLMYNPNLDDPLSPYFSPDDKISLNVFYECVKRSLMGEEVDGFVFEKNFN